MDTEAIISGEAREVTRAAALISVGNISSRVLGVVREMVKSYFFGAGGAVSAFDIAAQVPTMLYDLLAGGMLSSALVPIFSDYAKPERRAELWRLLSLLVSLLTLVLGVFILLLEVTAPYVARLLGQDLPPEYLKLATQMIRITTPAILFLNLSGLFSGVLYALRSFERPAFTATVSNATRVVVVVLLGWSVLESRSLAVGLLAGSVAQVVIQWPALKEARLRFVMPFVGHPALPVIGKLYLPIGLGLIMDQAAVALSFNLASRTGPSGIAWMRYAATLIQFPLGMVVSAVSLAILPTLSRYAFDGEDEEFGATLAQGLRLVLTLVLPATVGMLVLAEPLVALVFQRGNFMPADTQATAQALRANLLGLVFAALDQPLITAFYARKDTWTPALVGVVTTIFYTSLVLVPSTFVTLSLPTLIFANSLKLTAHALLMLFLFRRRVGPMKPYGVKRTALISLVASGVMALPMLGTRLLVSRLWLPGVAGVLTQVVFVGGVGAFTYLFVMRQLGWEELELLRRAALRRWNRRFPTE